MPPSGFAFKQPAPVLPAMGLHSFHADSPPFAGAATTEHGEPEALNIGMPPANANVASSQSQDSDASDAELSRARSRRLVSGYRFGNPPSPVAGHSDFRARAAAASAMDADVDEFEHYGDGAAESDSPPLTEPSEDLDDGDDSAVAAIDAVAEAHADARAAASAIEDRALSPSGDTAINLNSLALQDRTPVAGDQQMEPRKRSERRSHGNHGFDALQGLNDGEADADSSAPQAEHGTQPYLKGETSYRFPKHRLRTKMKDESKIPLVIVACGSFSPPTYLHLRMFEMAKDEIVESQTYEIMAGYYSPVSSYYKKAGLAPAIHRVRMCELAVEHTSTWLMVDPWEAGQPEYQRTAIVLDHFDEMLNSSGGVKMSDGSRRKYKVMLLAGGDLIESFGEPGVWSEPDLHIILGRFGCLIVERAGSDVWAFLLSHDILYHNRRNVIVIKQLIYNDISSTKVRLFVRRGMSIKYLLPNSVIQYIHEHKLYREADRKPITKA